MESKVWLGLVPPGTAVSTHQLVSIQRPLGYGPSTLPLRHDARRTPAGNRTRGERMGTVHFTTKPLVFTRRPHLDLCRNRGSNTGPSDGVPSLDRGREVGLQSDALPTELFRRTQA